MEVWHWKDVNVISEQKLTAARDRDRNALAAWHIQSGKLVALSTNPKEDVRLSKRGRRALALDLQPPRRPDLGDHGRGCGGVRRGACRALRSSRPLLWSAGRHQVSTAVMVIRSASAPLSQQ